MGNLIDRARESVDKFSGARSAGVWLFGTVLEFEGSEQDGPFLIVCKHASCRAPEQLARLGIASEHIEGHLARSGVARDLASRHGRPLASGAISRIECAPDLPAEAHDAIAARSQNAFIPGNGNPSRSARGGRISLTDRQEPALESLMTGRSVTPVWFGDPRDVEPGIPCGLDGRLARRVPRIAQASTRGGDFRHDGPNRPEDAGEHSLDRQGAANGCQGVMIGVRNDLIWGESAHPALAEDLADRVQAAMASPKEAVPQW